MTIGTTAPRVISACDGVSKVFPVPIQAYAATDFEVLLTAPASLGGATTQLALNGDFSMAPSSTDQPPKWTLTTLAGAAYAAGFTLQTILNPPQTQIAQFVQGQGFPSGTVQQALDRLEQNVQRLQDQINRCIRAPDGDVNPNTLLGAAISRALTTLGFDANGNVTASQLVLTTTAAGTASVASLAALRLLSPTLGSLNYALVWGNALAGDGGGGAYVYNAADHASADNGGSVIVSGDGGRWDLMFAWR